MTTFEPCYSDDTWHLIHCKARKELYAANMLRSLLDLSIYLPEWKVYSHKKVQSVPLFPGYIFAQVNLRKVALSQINATPGVLRLVSFGGTPQIVPGYVIEGIAERLQQMNGPRPQPFRQGDIVRLKNSGPLQDLEMIFVGPVGASQRVNVLLNFLGRLKEAQVNIEVLEKVRAS
ncbi:MAG TPA: transcription termination/antitermination NusG family protein [Ktedonobacteraceae bacterium]|nr:transcription termination/antitermination NusG family protein [Ktedonobacteraceae bacterium]